MGVENIKYYLKKNYRVCSTPINCNGWSSYSCSNHQMWMKVWGQLPQGSGIFWFCYKNMCIFDYFS